MRHCAPAEGAHRHHRGGLRLSTEQCFPVINSHFQCDNGVISPACWAAKMLQVWLSSLCADISSLTNRKRLPLVPAVIQGSLCDVCRPNDTEPLRTIENVLAKRQKEVESNNTNLHVVVCNLYSSPAHFSHTLKMGGAKLYWNGFIQISLNVQLFRNSWVTPERVSMFCTGCGQVHNEVSEGTQGYLFIWKINEEHLS